MFIPTHDFMLKQGPNVIFQMAKVYEENKNIAVAYQLIRVAIDEKFSPNSTMDFQVQIAKQLGKDDELSKEYIVTGYDLLIHSLEKGASDYLTTDLQREVARILSDYDQNVLSRKKGKSLDDRIPKSLKKKMKAFKKTYKRNW